MDIRALGRVAGAAVVAAAAVCAAPPAAAYPQVDVLTPGAPIATYAPGGDRALTAGCTAGWLARTATGDLAMLTAGHCAHLGDKAVWQRGDGDYVAIGYATSVVATANGTDWGVISLSGPVAYDARVLKLRRVAAATKLVTAGERICLYGAESGRQCGPVVSVTEDRIVADVQTHPGDSGGPVYWIDDTGVAYPVGLHLGREIDSNLEVVQPIAGVLREQNLTLIPGPAEASVVPVGR